MDLTLPPNQDRDASPLPQMQEQPVLPGFFEPGAKTPTQVSGKLLFDDGNQDGALDNINGAQVEVSIPVD